MTFFSPYTVRKPQSSEDLSQIVTFLKNQKSVQRRKDQQKRVDFYYEKQLQYLDDSLKDQFKDPSRLKLQKETTSLTKSIIDDIAILYNKEPIREIINGTTEDSKIYAEIVKKSSLNQKMQQINKFTKLCKTVAVRPVWRNNQIDYDFLTPNIYDVFQEYIDTTKPIAFVWGNLIDILNEYKDNNDDKRGKHDPWESRNNIYYYIDNMNFYVFSVDFSKNNIQSIEILLNDQNPDNINPYGVIPFVTSYDGIPVDQYFMEGGNNLVLTNEIINIKLTELNYLTKMQSFSIPVRKGAGENSDSIILDPSLTIDVPGDTDLSRNADFKFVSPDAKIKDVSDEIDKKIRKIAIQNNLNPERFVLSAQKSSAEALQIKAKEQAKILQSDRPYYRDLEQRLYNMTKIVWNYHNPNNQLSENSELMIDYAEIEEPMTQGEKDTHNITMYSNGLLSKAKWFMMENPDIKDEKQAKKIIEQIEEERKADIENSIPSNFTNIQNIPEEEDNQENEEES